MEMVERKRLSQSSKDVQGRHNCIADKVNAYGGKDIPDCMLFVNLASWSDNRGRQAKGNVWATIMQRLEIGERVMVGRVIRKISRGISKTYGRENATVEIFRELEIIDICNICGTDERTAVCASRMLACGEK